MGARIRKNGRIFCAALTEAKEGDIYISDGLLYYLSVEKEILVTTENDYHMSHGGEWWWKGEEPSNVLIDYHPGNELKHYIEQKKD